MSTHRVSPLLKALQFSVLVLLSLGLTAASCNDGKEPEPSADPAKDDTANNNEGKDGQGAGKKPSAPSETIAADTYPGFNLQVLDDAERGKFAAMARAELCPCPESTQSLHDCLRKEETQCEVAKYSAILIASGIKEKKSQTTILDEVAKYVEGVKKTYEFKLEDTPVRGNPDAKVVLVEFADFQCPHCRMVVPIMQDVSKKYGDKIAFYYKHFPLPSHPQAQIAGQAAEAAHRQGKFWEMHDLIFENQEALSKAKLRGFAQQIGLNMDKFNKDFDSPDVAAHVVKQRAEGEAAQIDGTPSLFINGKRYMGEKDVDAISKEIDKMLAGGGENKKDAK